MKKIDIKVGQFIGEKDLLIKFHDKKSLKEAKKSFPEIYRFTGFTAAKNEILLNDNILYVGVSGIKDKDDWRILGFKVGMKLFSLKAKYVSIIVPKKSGEFMQGVLLGTEPNDPYKSKKTKTKLKLIKFIPEEIEDMRKLMDTLDEAKTVIVSQLITKKLVDTTAQDANSHTILDEVYELFRHTNVALTHYDESDLEHLEMRGHLAVNRASANGAKTIKLEYNSSNKKAKNIVLVGKGLTYDTGGLSIKPTNSMLTMQADKAGAMTLVGLMNYISINGSKNNITCYIALAENCISSDAYMPGDVLEMKNGKTVRIKNTDAEGRLVLFDNLCLAEQENEKIDAIYSIATLTGSAVVQFGEEAAGLVGFNDKMKQAVVKSGNKVGEIFADAIFHKYMMDGVKDSIADLSNTGTPHMGCQKAGLFLTDSLTPKLRKKYLHIDIAGPAYTDKGFGSNKSGASGFGVRTLIDLVK